MDIILWIIAGIISLFGLGLLKTASQEKMSGMRFFDDDSSGCFAIFLAIICFLFAAIFARGTDALRGIP